MNKKYFMSLAINEAEKASGFEKPNPKVGAILVKDKKIIGIGHHFKINDNHAEINAVIDAEKKGFNVSKSTIFVTLQPCSKKGTTQSCTKYLIDKQIKEVVFGSNDQSDEKSIILFKNFGISVIKNVLEIKCNNLIKDFKFNNKFKKTYVVAKVAMSLDGYVALQNGESKWITSLKAREYSRKKRSNQQAILVGNNTIIKDNPKLNCRADGYSNPTIVILSSNFKIDLQLNIFKSKVKKIIFIKKKPLLEVPNTLFVETKSESVQLTIVLEKLWNLGIKSVLIEGGPYTISEFIKRGLVNELQVYIAPKIFGDTNSKKAFNFQNISKLMDIKKLSLIEEKRIDSDLFIRYEVVK